MPFGKYNILTSKQEILQLDNYLTKGNFSRISVDTETNGLFFWKNLVIGLSLSVNSDSGFYIPFLTWVPDENSKKVKKIKKVVTPVYEHGAFKCVWTGDIYPENVTPKDYKYPAWIVQLLKKWLYDAKPELIMHNAPFDVLMIESSLGINLQDLVFCDTLLLKHAINENSSNGLKETAILWSKDLGIPVEEQANKEQLEMSESIIKNGGNYKKTKKDIWRADLPLMGKYAIADTFLTYGIFEVGIDKFINEYEPKHLDWFFEDEVMPLCREVIIPMKRHGVRIDVDYFVEMERETREKMEELEDIIIEQISDYIVDFDIGASIDEVVTKKALVEYLIEREGLEYPTSIKNGIAKKSLAKAVVTKAYAETAHWLWGYLLGENEFECSEVELTKIKKEIYKSRTGKRNRFSISSDMHLRWLFCKKLGTDPRSLPQTESATAENPIASMKATVLKDFFYKDCKFVKPLLLWKKLQKLHGTYILPALELHNKGYLHMDFMQAGTTSGRFACRGGFNLQTLPRSEELDRCPQCGSKDVLVVNPIKLVAVMACSSCGHEESDILCPSAIKQGFIAPEGMKIVNADYSSLEPRCFSFMSGDPKLKEIYLKNLDMYSKIYCDMEDPEGQYSPDPKAPNFLKKQRNDLRTMVKPVVLGIPYGARDMQTARLMGFKKTVIIRGVEKEVWDVARGREFRRKYLDTYPQLENYMLKQDTNACANGFVETIVARRRHFKFTKPVYKILASAKLDIDTFLDAPKKELDTQAVDEQYLNFANLKKLALQCGFNLYDEKGAPRTWAFVRAMFKNELNNSKNFPIQGLGAHITNRAMLETARAFKRAGLSSLVVLQVHDEISTYSGVDEVDSTVELLKRSMEDNKYAKLVDIPMVADPLVANNLKEAK